MSNISDFIRNLSFRFRNENDLSDVTWCMCETSAMFKTAFLRFFFPCIKVSSVVLQREKSDDDSRPDFYFEYNGEVYLIEVKIYDQNHHFEQYTKKFKIPAERLGYITNYPMLKTGFTVKTWTQLYVELYKQIPESEAELWNGYLQFLDCVCRIYIPTRPMQLDGMYSLYTFYRCLDEVFANETENFTTSLYNSRKDTNNGGNFLSTPRDGVMGKYFEVTYKGKRIKKSWGWMGVYFEREEPVICIGFCNREGWGKPINSILNANQDKFVKGKSFDVPYEDSGAFWFDFRLETKFDSSSLEIQKNMLRTFLCEVLNYVVTLKDMV